MLNRDWRNNEFRVYGKSLMGEGQVWRWALTEKRNFYFDYSQANFSEKNILEDHGSQWGRICHCQHHHPFWGHWQGLNTFLVVKTRGAAGIECVWDDTKHATFPRTALISISHSQQRIIESKWSTAEKHCLRLSRTSTSIIYIVHGPQEEGKRK